MGQFLRGWEFRLCSVILALAMATSGGKLVSGAPPEARGGAASKPSAAEVSPDADAEVSRQESAAGVRAYVWMIGFKTSSRDSEKLTKDFGARLKAALVKSRAAGPSFDFQTSDELADVVREFRGKGKVVIRDEPVRFIASGETDKWVGAGSIAATSTPGEDGKLTLSASARFVSPRRFDMSTETAFPVESAETRILGSGTILGKKTRLDSITGRAGECQHFLISVEPAFKSDATGDRD